MGGYIVGPTHVSHSTTKRVAQIMQVIIDHFNNENLATSGNLQSAMENLPLTSMSFPSCQPASSSWFGGEAAASAGITVSRGYLSTQNGAFFAVNHGENGEKYGETMATYGILHWIFCLRQRQIRQMAPGGHGTEYRMKIKQKHKIYGYNMVQLMMYSIRMYKTLYDVGK